MKKFLTLVLAGLLALNLAGCGPVIGSLLEEAANATTTSDTTAAATTAPDADADAATAATTAIAATDGYAEGRLGDTMHTAFFDFTVTAAYTTASYGGYVAPEGTQLLVATVTVKNPGRQSVEMYDTDFQAQWNGDGDDDFSHPLTETVEPLTADQLPETYTIDVGGSRTGELVFEVPDGERDFSLSYLEVFSDESEGDLFFVYFTAARRA